MTATKREYNPENPKRYQRAVAFPAGMKERIQAMASAQNTSFNKQVIIACQKYLMLQETQEKVSA